VAEVGVHGRTPGGQCSSGYQDATPAWIAVPAPDPEGIRTWMDRRARGQWTLGSERRGPREAGPGNPVDEGPGSKEEGGVMRRGWTSLLLASVLAAAVIAVSLASASSASRHVSRLHVIERATTDTVVDLTANGDSTGDLLTFHNDLYDETNSDLVGYSHGECVRIEVGVSWECRWVNQFENGSITVEGPFFDARHSALAITGGTGEYRDAHGSMKLAARDEAGTEYDFIFRILVE